MQLRWYQRAAVDAVWKRLRETSGSLCVEVPTGGGKSAIIATIASEAVKQWQGRVIVLAHVKELLEQNAAAILRVCPDLDVGVYSAGLGMRATMNHAIVAGIQSVYNKAHKFGRRDLILIDEAHLIKPDGEGQYASFIKAVQEANPHCRVIGFTATPYRLASGEICGPDKMLNEVCYKVGVRALIAQGFLSNLVSKRGLQIDFSEVPVERGEFQPKAAEDVMNAHVNQAVGEILSRTQDRKSVLLFCQSKDHAKRVQARILDQGHECGYIDGDSLDRAETIRDFKSRRLKYLANINVLTTGFDAPAVDTVCLLRPTASPGLYYQMVGRGFRLSEGKSDCLILDFGANVERHGPVDNIEVRSRYGGKAEAEPRAKVCPKCQSLISPSYATCPDCGHEFPPPERQVHDNAASSCAILSEPETIDVKGVTYSRHVKRDADESTPATMRVDYRTGLNQFIAEYVCFEHTGFARRKAEKWWKARSQEPVPATVQEALDFAHQGLLAETKELTAVKNGRFWEIKDAVIGERPETVEQLLEVDLDDLPF